MFSSFNNRLNNLFSNGLFEEDDILTKRAKELDRFKQFQETLRSQYSDSVSVFDAANGEGSSETLSSDDSDVTMSDLLEEFTVESQEEKDDVTVPETDAEPETEAVAAEAEAIVAAVEAAAEADAQSSETEDQESQAEDSPANKDELLKKIYNDPEALKYLDTDGNHVLSDEEKAKFEAFVQGDKTTLSVEDLQAAYDKLKDGSFPINDYKNFDPKKPQSTKPTTPTTTTKPQTAQQTQGAGGNPFAGGAGGVTSGGGGYSGGGYNPSTPSKPKNNDPLHLNGKSADELQAMSNAKAQEISDSSAELSAVYSGTDEDVAAAQKSSDEAKDKYFAQLDQEGKQHKELVEQEKAAIQKIEQTQSQIDSVNSTIATLDGEVTVLTSQITNANSEKTALESAKSELETKQSEEPKEGEEPVDYSSQIQELQTQIDALAEQIQAYEKSKEDAEARKAEAEKQLPDLEKQLQADQEARDKIENGDPENGVIGLKEALGADSQALSLLSQYDSAQTAVNKVKADKVSSISSTIATQKADLATIDEKLQTVKAKEIKRANSVSNNDLFLSIPGMEVEDHMDGDFRYILLKPEGASPDDELPMMVYLHGDGPIDNGVGELTKGGTPFPAFTDEEGLNGFNGYIMIPYSSDRWQNQYNVDRLREGIDEFKETHNVGTTVLAGGSSGSDGAIKVLNQSWATDYFDGALLVSSFSESIPESVKSQIPILGVSAEKDPDRSHAFMINTFGHNVMDSTDLDSIEEALANGTVFYSGNGEGAGRIIVQDSNHNNIIDILFRQDADGDGNSDIMKLIFEAAANR